MTALLLAAGAGRRLGAARPKAFVEIGGKPMYAWSMRAFAGSSSIDRVVITLPVDCEYQIDQDFCYGLKVTQVQGADSRSRSVLNALEKIDSDLVLVHDSARPLITSELVDSIVREARERKCDGLVLATKAKDTIKECGKDDYIVRTLDRDNLWLIMTPQIFKTNTLKDAFAKHSFSEIASAFDDASLLERAGYDVQIFSSSSFNPKVTDDSDFWIVSKWIQESRASTSQL